MNRLLQSTRMTLLSMGLVVTIFGCNTNDRQNGPVANQQGFVGIQAQTFDPSSVVLVSLSTATHARPGDPPTTFDVQRTTSSKPPPGWEIPAKIPTKATAKNPEGAPACCGYDQLCCARQSDIDRGVRVPARQNFVVPFSDVPEATIKERAKDGPPITGFSELRVVDGAGTPFPWVNGPQQFEIRLIPEAQFGFIKFNNQFSSSYSSPHYGDPQHRSLGYGVTLPINPTPDKGRSLLIGTVEYWMYNAGEKDRVVLDHVKGQMNGSPTVNGERWVHVAAINAAEGVVYAYRATYDGQPYVFLLLPEVIVGFESPKAKTFGGTGRDRFATDFPYTLYRFPLGAGNSDTINCVVTEYEIRRWFPRAKDALKLPDEMPIIISMSQTNAEAEPQIRIMFL